jgi:hypothetical protein
LRTIWLPLSGYMRSVEPGAGVAQPHDKRSWRGETEVGAHVFGQRDGCFMIFLLVCAMHCKQCI